MLQDLPCYYLVFTTLLFVAKRHLKSFLTFVTTISDKHNRTNPPMHYISFIDYTKR